MINVDTAFSEQFLDVTVGKPVTQVPALRLPKTSSALMRTGVRVSDSTPSLASRVLAHLVIATA
jgi:hypothetical protein